jgi:hypothetical protein
VLTSADDAVASGEGDSGDGVAVGIGVGFCVGGVTSAGLAVGTT